ncbi:xcmT3 [Clostridium sp. CAG:433]|jgi:type IV pilus assembly protein PilA|nr:xcmT3 [Clostridium sp. CAG:433]
MKNNKKGFTLIELLAVIVILAIIMVIAVPQILNVIQSSRDSAWKSNVKLIEEGIELGEATTTTGLTSSNFSISTVCTAASDTSIVDSLKSVADISSDDTEVTCAGAGSVKVTGKGQFANQPAATITCTNGNCSTTYAG